LRNSIPEGSLQLPIKTRDNKQLKTYIFKTGAPQIPLPQIEHTVEYFIKVAFSTKLQYLESSISQQMTSARIFRSLAEMITENACGSLHFTIKYDATTVFFVFRVTNSNRDHCPEQSNVLYGPSTASPAILSAMYSLHLCERGYLP